MRHKEDFYTYDWIGGFGNNSKNINEIDKSKNDEAPAANQILENQLELPFEKNIAIPENP